MKKTNNSLINKTCTPCQGGVPPLHPAIASKLLLEIGNCWDINESGRLYKEYKFNNFIEVMEFVNKVATLAEEEGHHPDLFITWGKCTISIWTHKINGLTENDFILAVKIDAL